jgi:hypothetical protein
MVTESLILNGSSGKGEDNFSTDWPNRVAEIKLAKLVDDEV